MADGLVAGQAQASVDVASGADEAFLGGMQGRSEVWGAVSSLTTATAGQPDTELPCRSCLSG